MINAVILLVIGTQVGWFLNWFTAPMRRVWRRHREEVANG